MSLHNSKVYRIWQVLQTGERKAFTASLQIGGSEYLKLAMLLDQPNFPEEQETLFAMIFPGEKFGEDGLAPLFTDFAQKLEAFLLKQQARSNPAAQRLKLADLYARRQEEALFGHEWGEAKQQIKGTDSSGDAARFLQEFQLHRSKFDHAEIEPDALQTAFVDLSISLDAFYVVSRLKYACQLVSRSKVFQLSYDSGLTGTVIDFAEQSGLQSIPLVQLYLSTYRLLAAEQGPEEFRKLRELLESHAAELSRDEQKGLLTLCLNFAVIRLNAGQTEYLSEIFSLYQLGLTTKALLDGEELSPWTYKNIVSVALKLEELDWAEKFLRQYLPHIPEAFSEEMFAFNQGRIWFRRNNHKLAIKLLRDFSIGDIYTFLDARSILLQACWEAKEWDLLEEESKKLSARLEAEDMAPFLRQKYGDFVRYLLALPRETTTKSNEALRAEITGAEPLAKQDWLLAKLS